MKIKKINLLKSSNSNKVISIIFIVIFAGIGTYLLTGTHATGPYTSSEAESGTLASCASVQGNSGASGNNFVDFGSCSAGSAPTSPPVTWCEDANFPGDQDPYTTAPSGAVTVAAGNNGSVNMSTANTTYWFAPGTHTGVSVEPNNNDIYIGAPGAILSGGNSTANAFTADYQAPYYTGVVIEYLTITAYKPDGAGGVVNENGGPGWTIKYDNISNNVPGSAMMIGNNQVIQNNCLENNGDYGFNGYSYDDDNGSDPSLDGLTHGPTNITMNNNDITLNNTCNWDSAPSFPIAIPSGCSGISRGCGCAGGGKFWQEQNVTVDDNYVHSNYGDPGLWVDTGNDGFTFEGNYISSNWGEGIMYEVSYNTLIEDNTFIGNAVGEGPTNPGFPSGAIYISESGGDSRVPNAANIDTITISNNVFTNNWDGVVLWENSDRFCGGNIVYGQPDGLCTYVDTSLLPPFATGSPQACVTALEKTTENQPTDNPDYFDLCRWKTQNVSVTNNTFNFTASAIGSSCTVANSCGLNALFSNYGSGSNGIPYTGAIVPINITFNQNNLFKNNTYNGAWKFMAWSASNEDYPITQAQWQAAVTDKCSTSTEQSGGACNSGFGQDSGSTFNP